jgi:hypothetical protein
VKLIIKIPDNADVATACEIVVDAIRDLNALSVEPISPGTRFDMMFPTEDDILVAGWWKFEP